MNFNLHFGELHCHNSINDKNYWFENYIPKCYKVKRILISFNCFSEYILNINNVQFDNMVIQIYPSELNKANTSDTEAAYLDLHLSISNDIVSTKNSK